ncbi:pyridoxamine 5'-phosphate oxidase family protein [Tistrella mobilis]
MTDESRTDDGQPAGPAAEGIGFHLGERAVQDLYGLGERMASIGAQVFMTALPDPFRLFFMDLEFLVVASVDGQGLPWASLLAGPPGFIASPDPRVLSILGAVPAGDPLAANLQPGAALGLLGIDLATRRRIRVNGRVLALDRDGAPRIDLLVDQCFGNCPRYIRPRQAVPGRGGMDPAPAVVSQAVPDPRAREMIAQADTIFVASAADTRVEGRAAGADASHRGGPAGFVAVDEAGVITVPDYAGNRYFNTLGNMVLRPAAGLLVPDFATGDLLTITGDVEIVWQGPELARHPGAERLWRLRPRRVVHLAGAWRARLRETGGRVVELGPDGRPG